MIKKEFLVTGIDVRNEMTFAIGLCRSSSQHNDELEYLYINASLNIFIINDLCAIYLIIIRILMLNIQNGINKSSQ